MGIEIGNSLVLEQVADRAIGLARAREPRGLQHAVGAKGAQRERSALEPRRQFVAIARRREARPGLDGLGAAIGPRDILGGLVAQNPTIGRSAVWDRSLPNSQNT